MGLLAWIRREKEWRRDHIAAFSVMAEMQPDGFTLFQHQAIAVVAPFVSPDRLIRQPLKREVGEYLVGPIGTVGATLYIYPNEAAVFAPKRNAWFEEWDYRTPADLFRALVEECASRTA